ncbi:hypothetical protein BHE74_00015992 [Ensete ventricosum]|uniref:Uncharacterized protein n=1 Tax=Ensete ventricosum TaxID=4639 RepID=A0A444E9H1_ENSVE|nr:hypothetical protein GW17_00029630 [Ensete ventricosum]RWW75941.1 hypothetical protein BHE74_00015992 [Ensete ventricosum]RZR73415.1 hypothetical protein BHM03_00023842 [Ensete ventricosum]
MEPEGERRLPSRGDGTGSGDTVEKKVALMRIFVEGKDLAAKVHLPLFLLICVDMAGCVYIFVFISNWESQMQEVDNFMLRRFLCARDLDIEKASFLFLKYLKWRRTAVPNGFISEAEIRNDLSQKKVYMQGFDKTGQPIVVAFGAKHYHSKRNMNEFSCFVIYVLDRVCARLHSENTLSNYKMVFNPKVICN